MTIKQRLSNHYVGDIIELYEIDLNPIGVSQIIRLTPHSESSVVWRSNTYTPFAISTSGQDNATNQAPGRVTLSASTTSVLLTSTMIQYGDLVGATVRKWRTLTMYLDSMPTADPNQYFPVEDYIIIQRSTLSQDGVSWILANKLDNPRLLLPRRQCLKDVASRQSLYCAGMNRF